MDRASLKRIRNIKNKIKYFSWSLEAMARDKFICVDCGEKDYEKLLVHHIDESRKTGELDNSLENLLTLCRPCHAKHHNITIDRKDVVEMREMGLTFQQVGEKLGTSRQRAYQIFKKEIAP